MADTSILNLPDMIAALPTKLRAVCDRLLFVERVYGYPVVPETMHDWTTNYFGGLEPVMRQPVVRVVNRWTLDTSLFNVLRAKRPVEHADALTANSDRQQALEARIAASAGDQDMFQNPMALTPADTFGRIYGNYCVSASNIAKFDGWHGLVIFDEFHPLRFTADQFLDYFDVALRWLAAAHRADAQARYPLIVWNCLWQAGASLTHGHMHMTLSRGMAHGQVERWRRAMVDYRTQYGGDWFEDLGQAHTTLGVGIQQIDHVCSYASLTPVRDRELVLFSRAGVNAPLALDVPAVRNELTGLWMMSYTLLRALIDQHGMRSFNLAVYMPPLGPTSESWQPFPVCVRIVDRGHPLSGAINIGAMEMFAGNVIASDPFAVSTSLRP